MKVIFACVHNAGRSQMAAAFFNKFADAHRASAVSAGTRPADSVHPAVCRSMKNVGIDLSGVKPQLLTADLARDAEILVTMGCGEACPYVAGLKRDDWLVEDPKDKSDDEVAAIRDEIKGRVLRLLRELELLGAYDYE